LRPKGRERIVAVTLKSAKAFRPEPFEREAAADWHKSHGIVLRRCRAQIKAEPAFILSML